MMHKHRRILLLIAALAAVGTGCSPKRVSVYDRKALSRADAWHIDFLYPPAADKTVPPERAFTPADLQLRDDLFFRLHDRHGIDTVREAGEADAYVRLHTVHFPKGGFQSVDMTLESPDGKILGRVRVSNGERRPKIKDPREFADRCARELAPVMTGKRRH